MELCSNGHGEVCYDGRFCPVCEVKDELDDLRKEHDKTQSYVKKLEEENESQEEHITELEAKIPKEEQH